MNTKTNLKNTEVKNFNKQLKGIEIIEVVKNSGDDFNSVTIRDTVTNTSIRFNYTGFSLALQVDTKPRKVEHHKVLTSIQGHPFEAVFSTKEEAEKFISGNSEILGFTDTTIEKIEVEVE